MFWLQLKTILYVSIKSLTQSQNILKIYNIPTENAKKFDDISSIC